MDSLVPLKPSFSQRFLREAGNVQIIHERQPVVQGQGVVARQQVLPDVSDMEQGPLPPLQRIVCPVRWPVAVGSAAAAAPPLQYIPYISYDSFLYVHQPCHEKELRRLEEERRTRLGI